MKILITADWHIRGERPICRTDDDWLLSQKTTIDEIRSIFEFHGCEQMWVLGDVFDAPRCSTKAVNMLISSLMTFPTDSVRILCGNHDLKDHNIDNLEECSIGTLGKFFRTVPAVVDKFSVSAEPFGRDDYGTNADVVCTHQLTFPNAEARPIEDCGVLAQDLLDRWPKTKIIFTGDYHQSFIYSGPGHRHVVNPGCINIQKADELDYEPSVFIWDTDTNTIEKAMLDPHRENCTRDHIEAREQKEEMLAEVVETIKGGAEITLDFDSNLSAAIEKCEKGVVDEYDIVRQEIGMEAK